MSELRETPQPDTINYEPYEAMQPIKRIDMCCVDLPIRGQNVIDGEC
jgi:hypothetical protein